MPLHPLHVAAQLGDLEALRRVLAAGTDPDTPHVVRESTYPHNVYQRTALTMLCLEWGPVSFPVQPETRRKCIQALLDAGASPNRLDPGGVIESGDGSVRVEYNAPLTYATKLGDPAIVNALLRAGANPNYANVRGWTALMAAVNTGAVSCAIALIKAGADLELSKSLAGRRTPLIILAAEQRSPRMIPILLRAGARLDMTRFDSILEKLAAQGARHPPWVQSNLRANLTYIRRIDAAGGWKKYECRHRKQLTTTFARVVFPRLPIEAISNIVCFWAHVGFYAVA